jgi:Helix-turn-helix domain
MSLQAIIWAFGAPVDSVGAKFVLVALAEHAREDQRAAWACFPSVKRLASFTAQSERTVERHLAWLVQNGWISRQRRSFRRGNAGAFTYTFGPDKLSGHDPTSTRQTDALDPTKAASSPDNLSLPNKKEPSKEPVTEPAQNDRDFETWWAAYPRKVEKLGAKAVYRRIVDNRLGTADQLLSGAKRYADEVRLRDPQMVKHPSRWLDLGCWTDGGAQTSLRLVGAADHHPHAFDGPPELWRAAVARRGEDWAKSWLAPCKWASDQREVQARTRLAADRIREELAGEANALGIAITVATRAESTVARAAPNDLCASKGVVSTPSLRSGWR